MKITIYWCGRCQQDFSVNQVGVHEHAIVDWFMFCREVCMVTMMNESTPSGGKGVTGEIDESQFEKMKYGNGKTLNGQSVFGDV